MMIAAFVWGLVCLGVFSVCDRLALAYPDYASPALLSVLVGAAGVFGFSWTALRSARPAAERTFLFLLACGFIAFNTPIYRNVMEKTRADKDLARQVSRRAGEDEGGYCARLVPVLRSPDHFLRLGAARRLKACGASGRAALPQLALASDDPDILYRAAAKEAREAIEPKTAP